MKKFAFFLLILFIISCKKDASSGGNFSVFKNDTIFSKGNQIVFFKPSKEFYKKELINLEGIEEVDSDFNYYANEVYNDVNNVLKSSLKAVITDSRFLGIIDFKNDTTFIDRYKDSLHYGTLLNFDDKKYQIDEGVLTDVDFEKNFIVEPKNYVEDAIEPEDVGMKLNVIVYEEDRNYDTIINSSDFDYYVEIDFRYKKFDKRISENKVVFKQDSSIVIITKKDFNKNNYVISSTPDLGVTLNGQRLEGVDGTLPKAVISSISIILNNQNIEIKKRDYENLSEPNFKYSNVYKIDENNLLLEMHNSDGAGGYAFYFIVNKEGKTEKYIVYP